MYHQQDGRKAKCSFLIFVVPRHRKCQIWYIYLYNITVFSTTIISLIIANIKKSQNHCSILSCEFGYGYCLLRSLTLELDELPVLTSYHCWSKLDRFMILMKVSNLYNLVTNNHCIIDDTEKGSLKIVELRLNVYCYHYCQMLAITACKLPFCYWFFMYYLCDHKNLPPKTPSLYWGVLLLGSNFSILGRLHSSICCLS